jgi:protein AroM
MSETVVGVYTIGQTPRPDLTEDLTRLFASVRFEILGALDDLSEDRIPVCGSDGYPLETRLRDGTRVVVDATFLEPRLQEAIAGWDDHVAFHLVLCAGPFPHLTARRTLIQPFDVAVAELTGRSLRSLEVIVPFTAQAAPSAHKWEVAGFRCRMHVLGEKLGTLSVAEWLSQRQTGADADALVFDYVGFPVAILDEFAAAVDIPVFDLGRLAMDAFKRELQRP